MPAHPFVAKHASELPSVWKINPSEEWLAHAAASMALAANDIDHQVFYELPDCSQARSYLDFVKAAAERDEDVILVALTNHSDFDQAHGQGSCMRSLLHLHVHGFPDKFIRICYKRGRPCPHPSRNPQEAN